MEEIARERECRLEVANKVGEATLCSLFSFSLFPSGLMNESRHCLFYSYFRGMMYDKCRVCMGQVFLS